MFLYFYILHSDFIILPKTGRKSIFQCSKTWHHSQWNFSIFIFIPSFVYTFFFFLFFLTFAFFFMKFLIFHAEPIGAIDWQLLLELFQGYVYIFFFLSILCHNLYLLFTSLFIYFIFNFVFIYRLHLWKWAKF